MIEPPKRYSTPLTGYPKPKRKLSISDLLLIGLGALVLLVVGIPFVAAMWLSAGLEH